MSHNIAQLLAQPEHLVSKTIAKLEAKNGYPSHDVRHLAENIQAVRLKLTDLGLDPNDTTGEELYQALLAKFQKDAQVLDEISGATYLDYDARTAKAVKIVERLAELPSIWSLKTTAAKNTLRTRPPKKLMKLLNYRSVESLLKREKPAEIFLVAGQTESATWQKAIFRQVSQLDTTAFEARKISLCSLSYRKYGEIDPPGGYITTDDSAGAVALWPAAALHDAPLLSLVVLLLDGLNRYKQIDISKAAAGVSPIVEWWADMDRLVANLADEPVSMNLKDVFLNDLESKVFDERHLAGGRSGFWQHLLSRYQNQLEIEEDALASLENNLIKRRQPPRQPAYEFEYAEDI